MPGSYRNDRHRNWKHKEMGRYDDRMGRTGYQGYRTHKGNFMRAIGRQLDLSPEQREKIREIFFQERQNKQARYGRNRHSKTYPNRIHEKIKPETFMTRDHFDKAAFINAVQEQAAKRMAERQAQREKQLKQRADFMEKVFNILTPEQRAKWIQLSQSMRQN